MASIKALAAIALTLMIAAPIGLGYLFATEDTTVTSWESENRVNLSDTILNSEHPIYMDYTGTSNNTTLTNGEMVYNQVSSVPTAYPMQSIGSVSITFNEDEWVDLSGYPYWEIRITSLGTVSYQRNGDTSTSTAVGGPTTISGYGGSLRFTDATHVFTVVTYSDEGDYADINAGWKLALTSYDYGWTNNQVNETAKILVDMPLNSTTYLGGSIRLLRDNDGVVTFKEYRYPPTGITVPEYTLGSYQYVLAELTPTGWTVSGLTAWPNVGASYQKFNTIEMEFILRSPVESFETIALSTNSNYTTFRVESTTILSGSFPDTEDYTLDMGNLFPGKSYSLKLNSIGIYGESLTIAGETFTVTNGRISVDGSNISLKGATISSKLNGAEYDVYVNAIKIGSSEDPASITFNGEWSLTLTADILRTVENTSTQWAPGEFAFDKTDFAACGLLVAGALLVGLGMYGQRSGIKMGILLLICGGAALIYLTFV